jgi:ADP-ribose pyrophosphatase YjhB (NUDIX family)
MSSDNDPNQARTRAAVYIMIKKGNKAPFIKRSNTGYRDGEWAMPSGKVDQGESFSAAAIREAKEEVGVDIHPEDLEYVLTLHRRSDDKPDQAWVDVLFVVEKWEGEPYNAEPHKHGELKWLELDELPMTVMEYQRALVEAHKNNLPYVEFGRKEHEYDIR